MQVHVKMMSGKTLTFNDFEATDTITLLKRRIDTVARMPYRAQRLSYRGQELNNDTKSFSDCKIENGAVVVLLQQVTWDSD